MSDLQELLNAKNLEIVELKRRVAELEDLVGALRNMTNERDKLLSKKIDGIDW